MDILMMGLADLVAIGTLCTLYMIRHKTRELMISYAVINAGVFTVTVWVRGWFFASKIGESSSAIIPTSTTMRMKAIYGGSSRTPEIKPRARDTK